MTAIKLEISSIKGLKNSKFSKSGFNVLKYSSKSYNFLSNIDLSFIKYFMSEYFETFLLFNLSNDFLKFLANSIKFVCLVIKSLYSLLF